LLLKCLVVDDHRDGAEALGGYLRILGMDVRVTFSGHAAIELAHEFRPALVVLDINMPDLDGFETAKQLKQQRWAGKAVFVAHTGMRRESTSDAAFADFHHVLTKGDASEALVAIVDDLRRAD
jgi:CheY-like chemotaxis protein